MRTKAIKLILSILMIFSAFELDNCIFYKVQTRFFHANLIGTVTTSAKQIELIKSKVVIEDDNFYTATWYDLTGRFTSSGERFHRDSLTCAYNFASFGTLLKITNLSNESSVIVKVTDRMGYKGKKHIDLSKSAFDSIGDLSSGRLRVNIEVVETKKSDI